MPDIRLSFERGHLIAGLDGQRWLVDTGLPTSIAPRGRVRVEGRDFSVAREYLGVTVGTLAELVGVRLDGLLGADILAQFDALFDLPKQRLRLSDAPLTLAGHRVSLEQFQSVPIIGVGIAGASMRMFFDTGAPVSYLQDPVRRKFPPSEPYDDFFPGVGAFTTDTCLVEAEIAHERMQLRCGELPGLLGLTLSLAGVSGIVGNEVMLRRPVGFFPRSGWLVFG